MSEEEHTRLRRRIEELADDYGARLEGLRVSATAQNTRGDVLRYAYARIEGALRQILEEP